MRNNSTNSNVFIESNSEDVVIRETEANLDSNAEINQESVRRSQRLTKGKIPDRY